MTKNKGGDMESFYKRVAHEMSHTDKYEWEQQRKKYISREMAKAHCDGDGCMEDGE